MVEAWYHTISVHGACEISVHVKNVGAELMVDGNSISGSGIMRGRRH